MTFDEIWKPIKNFEGIYEISNYGNVKSLDRCCIKKTKSGTYCEYKIKGKYITKTKNNKGYCLIRLYNKSRCKHCLIHRLVAQAFIPNPDNLPEVNHKDENKENNCINNLEWCNRVYNNNYGKQSTKGRIESSRHRMRKVGQYDLNNNLIKIFDGIRIAERETNIDNRNICACCKGKHITAGGYIWKYIESGDVK